MQSFLFKRGSTFHARCTYQPPAGGAASLVGANITCEVRLRGTLVQAFEVTLATDGMSFALFADETETINWPVATCEWDIRIELNSEVIYSETLSLNIILNITAAPAPLQEVVTS